MPDQVLTLDVIDMHTAGEPVRIVTGGYPRLTGASILDKRREALEQHDALRRALMLEPRGHAGMYGVIPVEPSAGAKAAGAVFGALFIHNEGYSTMCGHATVALGKWLVESGQVKAPAEGDVSFLIELPCGVVRVTARLEDGKVVQSGFESVPAFLAQRDVRLEVAGLGAVSADLCYGGAFYLILPASGLGFDFFDTPLQRLVEIGTAITAAGRAQLEITHPDAAELGFLYGTILTDDAPLPEASFNLCIFAEGQIDRSPTGSGVTARLARDHARGLIGAGAERCFYGPTPVPFRASLASTRSDGSVTVRVSSQSAFSGRATFEIHSDDPLAYGFSLPPSYGVLRRRIGAAF
jgi:trans-L-3-hydroxyproline dehydratase